MNFFIPHAKSSEEAESVFASISKFNNIPITEKRVFKVSYEHNGKRMIAEVGKSVDNYYKADGEVIAILERDKLLCVCLPNRGVLRGSPILVGVDQFSTHIEYFD